MSASNHWILPFLVALPLAACGDAEPVGGPAVGTARKGQAVSAPSAERAKRARTPEQAPTPPERPRVFPRRSADASDNRLALRRPLSGGALTWPTCPKVRRAVPRVVSIGSSTMKGLAWVMQKDWDRWGIEQLRLAKAASGLARPDFYDWEKEAAAIRAEHDPDVWVAVLGTNDNQGLRVFGERRRWVRPENPRWQEIYGQRVRALMEAMDPDRSRKIILIGPSLLKWKSSYRIAPRITRIMREQVAAWDGDAAFIDAIAIGTDERGRILKKFKVPGRRRSSKVRSGDGIHFTMTGLRWLLAEPVYQLLRPCLVVPSKGPLPRRSDGVTVARSGRRPPAR